jgi:putative tryptophan/tyrosine transport system substrate-binding protein
LAGKWPELLKRIAPKTTRVAVLRDPVQFSGGGQLGAVQAVAPFFAIEITPVDVRNVDEMERAISEFAQRSNGALVVLSSYFAYIHRPTIIALAAQHRLSPCRCRVISTLKPQRRRLRASRAAGSS